MKLFIVLVVLVFSFGCGGAYDNSGTPIQNPAEGSKTSVPTVAYTHLEHSNSGYGFDTWCMDSRHILIIQDNSHGYITSVKDGC